jgi:hypothetical protein
MNTIRAKSAFKRKEEGQSSERHALKVRIQCPSQSLTGEDARFTFDTDENRPAEEVIEQIIVNGLRHPLRRPTIQFPEARYRRRETFRKSTYASGDAGIPGESQR